MKNKKQRGITLVALVITIIVLLILAGVAINMAINSDGLFGKANEVVEQYTLSQIQESLSIIKLQGIIDGNVSVSGTLESVLGTDEYNQYANKLYVINGKIVYDPDECNEEEINNAINYGIDSIEEYNVIRTAEELQAFRDEVNAGNTYEGEVVYLLQDITLNIEEEWEPIGTYLPENTSVSAETNLPFKGTFDGGGNEINGLKVTSQDKGKGLFGLVNGGIIKNLGIGANCNINAGVSFGSIAGYLVNNSSVINCYNKSNITTSGTNTGGIVGTAANNNQIIGCFNLGTISGSGTAGGIVGSANGQVTIEKCYNIGSVTTTGVGAGGIIGTGPVATILACYSNAEIIGSSNVGGISGGLSGKIENCYSISNVTGTSWNVGGIIGGDLSTSVDISNCYFVGTTTGAGNTGDIIGYNQFEGAVTNCYSNDDTFTSSSLGSIFKNDYTTDPINNGYPILDWQ